MVLVKGAGLPDTDHLQMQMVLLAGAGIDDPEMGFGQVEVTAHQGQQATEHHGFDLAAIGRADHAPGGLLGIGRHVLTTDNTDGPVLRRFGDGGDGVLAHVVAVVDPAVEQERLPPPGQCSQWRR